MVAAKSILHLDCERKVLNFPRKEVVGAMTTAVAKNDRWQVENAVDAKENIGGFRWASTMGIPEKKRRQS